MIHDSDPGYKKFRAQLEAFKENSVVVGLMEDSGYVPGTEITTAQLGAVHEFGTTIEHPGGTAFAVNPETNKYRFVSDTSDSVIMGRTGTHQIVIPQRSFIRSTIDKNAENIQEFKGKVIDQVFKSENIRGAAKAGLAKIGQYVQNLIQNAIRNGDIQPDIKEATKRRKGSSKVLVDTGHLVNSITYKVRPASASDTESTVTV